MIVSGGKINSGNAQFRRDKRNVGKGTLRGFEAFTGNISLEVRIGTVVVNGVIFAFAVKLDNELKLVKFIRKLVMFMSAAESLRAKSADFFVTGKEEPRFNLRGLKDFDESKDPAAIIATNSLRTH